MVTQIRTFGLIFLCWATTFLGSAEAESISMDGQSLSTRTFETESVNYILQGGFTAIAANAESTTLQIVPLVITSICGNGILEAGEACDQGDFGGATCQDFGFQAGNLQCDDCHSIRTNSCSAPEEEEGTERGEGGSKPPSEVPGISPNLPPAKPNQPSSPPTKPPSVPDLPSEESETSPAPSEESSKSPILRLPDSFQPELNSGVSRPQTPTIHPSAPEKTTKSFFSEKPVESSMNLLVILIAECCIILFLLFLLVRKRIASRNDRRFPKHKLR